ncbi:MAG: hypothetical protein E7262_09690 [Lachnospiraceae bacterium]|nr:hypothetical protein [Lachnospiraceae bacterium]
MSKVKLTSDEIVKVEEIIKECEAEDDFNLTKYIGNILSITDYKAFEGWYDADLNETHITFIYLNDADINFADDSNEDTEYYLQVDIWSKESCEKLRKKVKALLKKANFEYITGNNDYEAENKLYHIALRVRFEVEE